MGERNVDRLSARAAEHGLRLVEADVSYTARDGGRLWWLLDAATGEVAVYPEGLEFDWIDGLLDLWDDDPVAD